MLLPLRVFLSLRASSLARLIRLSSGVGQSQLRLANPLDNALRTSGTKPLEHEKHQGSLIGRPPGSSLLIAGFSFDNRRSAIGRVTIAIAVGRAFLFAHGWDPVEQVADASSAQ